jgi:NADH-quinone oxidoreductase subunit H
MRFALFFLAEYSNMLIVSAVATTLFFGGWKSPFPFLDFVPGLVWFFAKTYVLIFVTMWVRWTFPRLRFDQLMNFCWKIMIPAALLHLIVYAGIIKLIR